MRKHDEQKRAARKSIHLGLFDVTHVSGQLTKGLRQEIDR